MKANLIHSLELLSYLQHLLTADIAALAEGQATYAFMCNPSGGTVDDVFIYRLPGRYMLALNAANLAKDLAWMREAVGGCQVTVEDISPGTYMLALQGPAAQAILQPLTNADLAGIKRHCAIEADLAGTRTLIGRTGYTGEDGYELYLPAVAAETVWDALLDAGTPQGLLPAGLAARDSLRFEACLPLYGQELDEDISPLAAGLGWAVKFDKGAFIGREALLAEQRAGSPTKLAGLRLTGRGVPRHGYPVLADGEVVGHVTSGMYAPTLDGFYALAYLPADKTEPGTPLAIEIRGKLVEAQVVNRPFYSRKRGVYA